MKLKTALQYTQESNNGCMGNGVTGISQLWSAWLCSLNSITFECLFKGKNEFCYLSPQQKLSDRTSLAVLETLTCSSAFLWATRYEQMYCRTETSGTAGPLGNTKATSEPRHISCSYPVYWLSFLSWHIQLNINPLIYLDGTLTIETVNILPCSYHEWEIPRITEIDFGPIHFCGHLRATKLCSCFQRENTVCPAQDQCRSVSAAAFRIVGQLLAANRTVHSRFCWKQMISWHYILWATVPKGETGSVIYSPSFSPATD